MSASCLRAGRTAIAFLIAASALSARVRQIDVEGAIEPVTSEVVASAIAQAQQEHADAVLIRLSTPGGLMDPMRDIVEQIFRCPIPVIVWTGPSGARAASAGFFLLEAGDVAAMAPGTNTGASHPVLASGSQMDPILRTKIENDAAALMRTIAEHRGRNEASAEKTVRESASYTEREALDQHLIDVIAPDAAMLIRQLDGRQITRFDGRRQTLHLANEQIDVYAPSLRQKVLLAIADPNIALLLLVLGAIGIYVEFSSPGLVAPGVFGAVLALLGLSALSVFPIDWLGAALMVVGFASFVLEAKFTTHGVLTAAGAIALMLGAVLLIDTNVPELRIHWLTAAGLAIPFALITSLLLSIAVRARRNKVVTGVEGMVGLTGIAVGDLDPAGKVLVRGEYWNARAPASVAAKEPVRVTGVDGLTLRVVPEMPRQNKEA
ncbi:MAG TPA: nodulation protein NfeD [Bryobacteraceae bacterium]|nr:nodulation protein NfeD [Bryobacteraceae bacterium]